MIDSDFHTHYVLKTLVTLICSHNAQEQNLRKKGKFRENWKIVSKIIRKHEINVAVCASRLTY